MSWKVKWTVMIDNGTRIRNLKIKEAWSKHLKAIQGVKEALIIKLAAAKELNASKRRKTASLGLESLLLLIQGYLLALLCHPKQETSRDMCSY